MSLICKHTYNCLKNPGMFDEQNFVINSNAASILKLELVGHASEKRQHGFSYGLQLKLIQQNLAIASFYSAPFILLVL